MSKAEAGKGFGKVKPQPKAKKKGNVAVMDNNQVGPSGDFFKLKTSLSLPEWQCMSGSFLLILYLPKLRLRHVSATLMNIQ